MNIELKNQEAVKRSALWAAYGDALGYITELTDGKGLKWRTGKTKITTTIPWRRKIGGRFGVVVQLPAGCYSDDTQLRLATCRAIRGNGKFDVEAFAKVELPVWLSYALGAGRGSKAAAAALTRRDTAWTNNFFDNKTSRYINCGGNGAAMRIQPHVWAASDHNNCEFFLPDVIKNAICTHGHARGILGAAFHALCVAYALQHMSIPGPKEWQDFIDYFNSIPKLIRKDRELNDFWLPTWEQSSGQNIEKLFSGAAGECRKDIELIREMTKDVPECNYPDIVKAIGGMSPQYRGSGTKTAILAAALGWFYKDRPKEAMEVAVNLLGSDTDTIATMSGAILGAAIDEDPPGEICDKAYIKKEASRLYAISHGEKAESFTYPDLLKWNVSSVQSDFVGTEHGRLAVSGLGYVEPLGTTYQQKGKSGAAWQWLQLTTGQQIFAKRRLKPVVIPIMNLPLQVAKEQPVRKSPEGTQASLFDIGRKKDVQRSASRKQLLTLDQATKQAINSGFDPAIIGRMLLEFSERNDGIELAMGFSAIIAKARMARIAQKG